MKRSPLIILFVTIFIDLLGFGIILPQLPIYITHYGGKPWVGGALLACFSIMQFIFSPIWGRVSDLHGRRPMILLSLLGSSISFFFFGAAPNLLVLFIARIAAGILSAASLPTSQAYIADVTPPEKRAGGMAVIGAAFGLGFAFGPVVGGFMSQHPIMGIAPLAMPAFFAAALSLLNFTWAFFMLPETHTDRTPNQERGGMFGPFLAIGRALENPAIRAQLIVFGFVTFAFTAVESSFSWLVILRFRDTITHTAAKDWQAHNIGAFLSLPHAVQETFIEKASIAVTSSIFAIVGLTFLIVQVAMMRGLSRKVGEIRLVRIGAFLLLCALIGIAFANSILLIQILSVMIAVGTGVMNPSLNALITRAAGPQERGTISGAQQGLGSLARVIAPPINNFLVGFYSAIPFICSAVLMSIAFALSLSLKNPPNSGPVEPVTVGH
jgi:DHA1 family tetracycline resistance protein-like MFS transporter